MNEGNDLIQEKFSEVFLLNKRKIKRERANRIKKKRMMRKK